MATPLTLAVVDQAIGDIGLSSVRASDNGRHAKFGPWPDAPAFSLTVAVDDEVLVVRVSPCVGYPLEYRGDLLAACNAWHERFRWPRWYVSPISGGVSVVGDVQVPCRRGLDADQLADVILAVVAAAKDFWSRLHDPSDAPSGLLRGLGLILDIT